MSSYFGRLNSAYPTNVRLFIWFRIFFNCRFYYPVFAVLFLDYGMTVEQFSLLNVGWAAAIVLLEVPSGALADLLGRRAMIMAASLFMVLEMALLALVPLGNLSLVFWVLLANRILSGAAEASASGADEALAFDSLREAGREKEWPDVLSKLMRRQSVFFVLTMLCGAMVYDAELINRVSDFFHANLHLTKETCIRIPVYLTLLMGLGACAASLRMKEPAGFEVAPRFEFAGAWKNMKDAAVWILHRPSVAYLLVFLVACDSIIRLHLTLGSQYLRLVKIPEASFGLFSALFAGLGFFVPKMAEKLVKQFGWKKNFCLLALYLWLSLWALSLAVPYAGVVFSLFFSAGMFFIGYFASHYLNEAIDSKQRATILSFKGLSINLGYGAIGLVYAGWVRSLDSGDKDAAYAESIKVWPWYFLGIMILLLVTGIVFRKSISRNSYEAITRRDN
jgi:MFS family permease